MNQGERIAERYIRKYYGEPIFLGNGSHLDFKTADGRFYFEVKGGHWKKLGKNRRLGEGPPSIKIKLRKLEALKKRRFHLLVAHVPEGKITHDFIMTGSLKETSK